MHPADRDLRSGGPATISPDSSGGDRRRARLAPSEPPAGDPGPRVEPGRHDQQPSQAGDEPGHRASIDYALARQTSLGLLPEQVTRDGEPAWVVPLGWSHAMFILAARPELAIVDDGA